jgi:uncharacterized RDD family membrane protein YckC
LSGTEGPRTEPHRSSQTFVTTDESRPLQERDVHVVGRRVLACLFDCSLVLTPALAALTIVAFVGRPGPVVVVILLLLALLAWCALYFVYVVAFEGFRGQTLGKMFLGIEVIRAEDGGVPGPGRAALRALTFMFADMIAGLLVMLSSPGRQWPGDMVANTFVVRKKLRLR